MSLVGLPALQALLYHCQYFQHVAVSASKCYRGRYTFHLQPPADATSGPSPQETNSLGRFYFLCNCILALFSQRLCVIMLHPCLDSENSLWFWRCDPQAPTVNSSRPSSSLSTSSTVVSIALVPSDIHTHKHVGNKQLH